MDRITQSSLNRFAHLFAAETLVSRPICRYPELFRDDSRNFPRIDVLPARRCRERFSGVKIVMLLVHDYGAFIHGIPHHADNVCSREWFSGAAADTLRCQNHRNFPSAETVCTELVHTALHCGLLRDDLNRSVCRPPVTITF